MFYATTQKNKKESIKLACVHADDIVDSMEKMKVLFAIAILLVFGYTYNENIPKNKFIGFSPKQFTLNADDIQDYPPGACFAMVCKNKTPQFPYNLFFDASLKNSECSFQACNEVEYNKFMNGSYKNQSIRLFMFGIGHSFFSFSNANAYCNNSMKLSVKWLVGGKDFDYSLPTKDRAECFLDKNILPTYILYSNFENVNVTRAGKIAKILNGTGPAILVSEAELDNSDPSRYETVKNQIIQMKSNCPKCLIALGVKLNGTSEYDVINKLFSDVTFRNNVDIVAYGINSHYFKDCNSDKLIWYGMKYSHYLLHTYSKPSLITYVLFDEAESSDKSCIWSNISVSNGYSNLYVHANDFTSNGIIGVSVYSLYGGGPLVCENCEFIDINSLLNPKISTYEPRFSNYFGFCQAYYTHLTGDAPNVIPLVYSTGSRNCNYAWNSNFGRFIGGSDMEIKPINLYEIDKIQLFSFCASCIKNGTAPNSIETANGFSDYCYSNSPIIELAADNFDMDPTLLRAAAWQESTFNNCSVSEVKIENDGCNPLGLSSIFNSETKCAYNVKESGNKICAYGLIQVIEYPSEIYEKNNLNLPTVARVCGKITNNKIDFNPFRPYDSACGYAYKFMNNNLPAARNLVNLNIDKLDIKPEDESKKEWISIFLALYGIYGQGSMLQQDWIDKFAIQKDIQCSDCIVGCDVGCGNKDFFTYVKYHLRYNYGYDVLAKYKWLVNPKNCPNTQCAEEQMPDQTIIKYVCETEEMEKDCCNAAKTGLFGLWGEYSAKHLCENPPLKCMKYCPNK